jgi:hypothetical protein
MCIYVVDYFRCGDVGACVSGGVLCLKYWSFICRTWVISVGVILTAGVDAVSNLKNLSPEAKERLQGFIKSRVEVAKECVQEFLEGYKEGKEEETARQAAELQAGHRQ